MPDRRPQSLLERTWSGVTRGAPSAEFTLPIPREGLDAAAKRRVRWFRLAVLLWCVVLFARLADLQIVRHASFKVRAARQHQSTIEYAATRGSILDRRGRDLALSTPTESIGVFASRIDGTGIAREAVAGRLAEVLNVDAAALRERLRRGGFQWAKRLVTIDEARRVRELGLDVLHFETESRRYYPQAEAVAHVVGMVGLDHGGQAGVEQTFEEQLRGEPGLLVLNFDARQKRYGRQVVRPSVAGDDVILEIDLDLQAIAALELERAIHETKSRAGTVVLMDPVSGAVRAMASWPAFDPNRLSRSRDDLERTKNFAVSFLAEPGSTFKVLTATAALEEGLVTPADEFDCEMGGIWVGRRRIRDHHPYGLLTMPQVLIKSSNVGIIKIGQRLGREGMYSYVRRFGFGSRTGVALPGEAAGLVRTVDRWSGSSLESMAMGQEVGVTALQMARLFSAVANGGMLVQPSVVHATRRQDGTLVLPERPEPVRVMSAETAATMKAILEQVVETGTGRRARIPGYRVAGKTGTAQMINPVSRSYRDGFYLASFCGFTPVNKPALVGVAMLYDPRGGAYYGGLIAAPLFQKVVRRSLRVLDVPPLKALPVRPEPPPPDAELLLADFVWQDDEPDAEPAPLMFGDPADAGAAADFRAAAADPSETRVLEAAAPKPHAAASALSSGRQLAATSRPDSLSDARPAPDLRGLTLREAVVAAGRLGVEIRPAGSGLVRAQVPAPGEPLPAGEPLLLQFGLLPPVLDGGSAERGSVL